MKKTIIILVAGIFIYACQTSSDSVQETESEGTISAVKAGFYGETIDESNIDDVTILHDKLVSQDSVMTKIQGTIVQTCPAKGCWMSVAMSDGDTLRVTFKDYGFFVPKSGMKGKQVIFQGLAKKDETSVEALQHFAKDGGATEEDIAKITTPKQEINFIASGVMIREIEK